MIYPESKAGNFECRAPGAFVYEKASGEYFAKFSFPRCTASKCSHWQFTDYAKEYLTTDGVWVTHMPHAYMKEQYQLVPYAAVWEPEQPNWNGVITGRYTKPNLDRKGQCGLNFAAIEVNVT